MSHGHWSMSMPAFGEEQASRIKLTCVEGAIVGSAQSEEAHHLRPGK